MDNDKKMKLQYRIKTKYYHRTYFHANVTYFQANNRKHINNWTMKTVDDGEYTIVTYIEGGNIVITPECSTFASVDDPNVLGMIEWKHVLDECETVIDDPHFRYCMLKLDKPSVYVSNLMSIFITDEKNRTRLFKESGDYEVLEKGDNRIPDEFRNVMELEETEKREWRTIYRRGRSRKKFNKNIDKIIK